MWTSFHAAVGGVIVAVSPDPVTGMGLAFISHHVADYLGESGYKNNWEALAIEGSLSTMYFFFAIITGHFWLLMGGWFFANLPDIIDNFRTLVLGKKKWFACHNGPGLFQITIKGKTYKLGFPTKIKFTREQTITINILSIITAFVIISKVLS